MTDPFGLPFDDPPPPPRPVTKRPQRRVFTISELTAAVRTLLETNYAQIWVEGEISNARVWNTGHLYFTLKDQGAQLKAVMFRSSVRYLRFTPENGQQVLARGRVSVYDPKGEYQFVCEHIEPQGVGARQLAYEQLRERLDREGLFDTDRKRPLPMLPRKIGIVTSLDGAAVRDLLKVLHRRWPNAHIVISPTRVQGDGAPVEIARALKLIGQLDGIDVVIVTRGGGSIEDLWAFNDEGVARAVAQAPVPVISAVGHESDNTICDFVSDLRAPTPSAAAELVVSRHDDFIARIARTEERLTAALHRGIQRRRDRVHELERRPGLAGWPARLAFRSRHASEVGHRLSQALQAMLSARGRQVRTLSHRLETLEMGRRLARVESRLETARMRLRQAADQRVERERARLGAATARLEALSPLAVLARGYAVCWNRERTAAVRSVDDVSAGDIIRVTLHHGELDCEVRTTEE
jgi:exodeoxyribonuclease VII large subunit